MQMEHQSATSVISALLVIVLSCSDDNDDE